jgi:polyisoprenoid-binding protein YceI
VEGKVKSGKLTLGGEGEIVFDMKTFTADTAEARQRFSLKGKVSSSEAKKVTTAMLSDQVLDVEKFPTATFRITSIAPADKQAAGEPGNYLLEGPFTLHGVEKKLAFKARLEAGEKKGMFKLSGAFPIKHSDHGMKPVSALGGLASVADELQIAGDLILTPGTVK